MFKVGDYITSKNLNANTLKLGKIVGSYYDGFKIHTINNNDLSMIGRDYTYDESRMEIFFKVVNMPTEKKSYICACCGHQTSEPEILLSSSKKHICEKCYIIGGGRGYSNDVPFHHPVSTHKTYGFEFECVPKSTEDYLSMLVGKYHLLPTFDCTLPYNGVELKSPMYHGLNGVRKLFKTFDKYVKFSAPECGQHINIGDTKYINYDTIDTLRHHTKALDVLYHYLAENAPETKKICGRFFTGWAQKAVSYSQHSSWISLEYNNRLEFRLSKFTSPNQYFELTCMWSEVLDCLIDNIIKAHTLSDREVGNLMIDIFKKYVNRQAKCQK